MNRDTTVEVVLTIFLAIASGAGVAAFVYVIAELISGRVS